HDRRAVLAGEILELAEEPPAEPHAAQVARDPHALDVGRLGTGELHRTAADGPPAKARDEEEAVRERELRSVGRDRLRRVEAGVEAVVQLREVLRDAEARVGASRAHDPG